MSSEVTQDVPPSSVDASEAIARLVRPVEDWPEPGVTFRDVTPLLADSGGFHAVLGELADAARAHGDVDAVLGVESRGFILGAPIARELSLPFVPVRKAGKLPAETVATSYDLEYGTATIEIHADALAPGARVVVVDDVLATGGTLAATRTLVEQCGAHVAGHLVMIEIAALGGRQKLDGVPLTVLHSY
ncbi:adenine phosphoribosyltransferase [Aeromicrobium sp. CTD01-1L150]|uniref:adenine phosphoribosyltransferase n=1 Tax=Aeromicrobium sp. CTD01-1L150 TaxID=3341830 RepID=UPI0035C05C9D